MTERARWSAAALTLAALLSAACSGGSSGTGPGTDGPDLRAQALAAGLSSLPAEPVRPVDNPYDGETVALGRLLFFDPILSGPRDVACSTCHLPRFAFTDGRQFPSGAGGTGLGPERTNPSPAPLRLMPRNSPPLFNVGFFGRGGTTPTSNGTMFWSGSAFGLEDQTLNPITADNELRGLTYSKVVALDSVLMRLRRNGEYLQRFADANPELEAAFGMDPHRLVTSQTLRRALAAYIRELFLPATPLDAYLQGDDAALSAQQKAGLQIFLDARCVDCHSGPLLSDFSMHVLGTGQAGVGRDTTPGDDLGWGEHGGTPYSFRTPPLRQVALTGPYFHAGTEATLLDVLEFKNRGRSEHSAVADADLDTLVEPLDLSAAELQALVAFLESLTDTLTTRGPLFQAPDSVPSGLEVPR